MTRRRSRRQATPILVPVLVFAVVMLGTAVAAGAQGSAAFKVGAVALLCAAPFALTRQARRRGRRRRTARSW